MNDSSYISADADVDPTATIGRHVVIHNGVHIGANSIVGDFVVVGEPCSEYYGKANYKRKQVFIGSNCLIRSHTIIYEGVKIGDFFSTGHFAVIREGSVVGNHCSIGTYSELQGDCQIGDYSRLQSHVTMGQLSSIGKYVFLYPFVVLTNDLTPPSEIYRGPQVGDYTQVASSSVLLANASIGQHSLVGAGSIVGGEYPDDSFINGKPAKRIGQLSKMPFFNRSGKRHYPWPRFFDRGMPWQADERDNSEL